MPPHNDKLVILLVEDSPSDALLMQEALAQVRNRSFEIKVTNHLERALKHLASETYDAVLLDLSLPDSTGLETLSRVLDLAPDLPVLVITALDDEETGVQAVQLGAQDYLVKNQLQPNILGRAISYAVERQHLKKLLAQETQHRIHDQERELQSIDRLSIGDTSAITARVYDAGTLREVQPQIYQDFVGRYQKLLSNVIEESQFVREKDHRPAPSDLRGLACELGPRDVVEFHTEALRNELKHLNSTQSKAFMEEGRLVSLQLMGFLVDHYRHFCAPYPGNRPAPK